MRVKKEDPVKKYPRFREFCSVYQNPADPETIRTFLPLVGAYAERIERQPFRQTKDFHGWMRPALMVVESCYNGRWGYWLTAVANDKIPDEPIPYIEFSEVGDSSEAQKMVRDMIAVHDTVDRYRAFCDVLDWILWAFGARGQFVSGFPNIPPRVDEAWYDMFFPHLFYLEPGDHMAFLLGEYTGSSQSFGYFPTPLNLCDAMTRMTLGPEPSPDKKDKAVYDPAVGTGSTLFAASNYSLFFYTQDISALACKCLLVNAYLFIPSMAFCPPYLGFGPNKNEEGRKPNPYPRFLNVMSRADQILKGIPQ